MGDFSEILCHQEKKGGSARLESHMKKFRNALSMNNLSEIKCASDPFTWSNKHEGESFTKERLDQVVANNFWKWLFAKTRVEGVSVISSNHKPLLMYMENILIWMVKKSFRFEAC